MTARLRILMETVPDTDVVAAMLPAFHAEHPDVRVDVEAMHYDDMSGPTLASLRADEPDLDLVILDNPWVDGLVAAGRLEPLDERVAAAVDWEAYYPTLRAAAEIGGRIWGVPFYTWTPGLVYRRDLWEAAGLSAPSSVEELAAAAKALTIPGWAGIAMQPRAGYDLCEEFGSWLFAAGGAIQDGTGRVVLDSAAARHALAVYVDVHANAAPPPRRSSSPSARSCTRRSPAASAWTRRSPARPGAPRHYWRADPGTRRGRLVMTGDGW
jgi:multiple sugar transport system substrate-binding protein